MELLLEAQKFATLVSNLEVEESVFDTEAKVKTSLMLANLTLDVNHVLGALIYLTQSVHKDLETFAFGGPKITVEVPHDFDASILTTNDLVLELVPNLATKTRQRSKSVDCSKSRQESLLETPLKDSDAKSQKAGIHEPTDAKQAKAEERKVLDGLAELNEDALAKKLSELGCRVDLTHILKTGETQGARLLSLLTDTKEKVMTKANDPIGCAFDL